MSFDPQAIFANLAEKERIKGHHSPEGRAIRTLSRGLHGFSSGSLSGRDVVVLCDQAVEDWLKGLAPSVRKRANFRGIPDKLEKIRRRGFHKEPSANVTGVTNLSYPIKNHLGDAVAALTLLYLRQTTNPARLGTVQQMVSDAAREISAAIGAQ